MNDSELDFVDLCSKLLKRVRKKPDDHKQVKKPQTSSQTRGEDKRKGNPKKDGISVATLAATQPVNAGGQQWDVSGETLCDSGDPGTSEQTAKDKVLVRMQQFKRDCPQKMVHKDVIQPTHCSGLTQQQNDSPAVSSDLQPDLQENTDEALALQLQQELDREAATVPIIDLEDGGLFFCQICHKDLSRITPDGRTQHLNRCLDGIEETTPAPLPTSAILNCPICGKNFKSQKSRSAHLKRCSSEMGVSAAVLLQALQRQTEESQSSGTSNTLDQVSSSKRKGPTKPSLPAKKPKKNHKALDEDMMVALALSSSLLDQEQEQQRKEEAEGRIQSAASHHSVPPLMKRGTAAGRGVRRTKKKGTVPRPPPLLLLQDPEAALVRLQERVSELLLRSWPSPPPTPSRCTSTLPGWSGATPLWKKTALLDEGFSSYSDFYAAELREFFLSSQPVTTDPASLGSNHKPESFVQLEGEGAPASSKTAPLSPAASPPATGQLLVDSQALRDLMELAEDGMTLTQCGYTRRDHQGDTGASTNLQLSGFVLEEEEEPKALSTSGFVPETAAVHQNTRTTAAVKAEREKTKESAALCGLAADLSSMVNNPQLSDVQLQVDSGEIFYAHTFMLYARCPLLAEMLHESGIRVKEEGLPAAHRILMNDVPGQAVFALLRYLYTSHCSIHASVRPHVLELASRFDLQELQHLCKETTAPTHEESNTNQVEETHTDEAFMELLRSMWIEGNEDEDGMDSGGGTEPEGELQGEGEAEKLMSGGLPEERVNEEELEEIYEFAATQKKREEQDSEEEEEEDAGPIFTKLVEPNVRSSGKAEQVEQNQSLDRSYNCIFSEEGDLSSPKGHISEEHPRRRTLLQSSDNMSPSPPSLPSTSNLPVAGHSPAQVIHQSIEGDLKRESGCAGSLCVPVSPETPPTEQEFELIVLSGSSEEMLDVQQRVTETSPPSDVEHKLSPSPGEPLDCSPELSWLIPSTPDQLDKNTTSSSAYTRKSICRTTLFPKTESSLSISAALSRHTSKGKGDVSPPTGGCSSSKDAFNASEAEKWHPSRLTHPPSLQETSPIKCYSSTPLHTELHLPHVPLLQDSVSDHQPSASESPLNNEVQCFHLSVDSEPSAASSAHRSLNQSWNHDGEITEKDVTRRKAKLGEESSGCDVSDAESSFQQRFMDMDEPPIAFNDSWNLNVCSEANAENFSLRLNDSESTSQHEPSPGKQRSSSSSSRSAPSSSSSSSLSVDSVNSSRGKTLKSPGKIPHQQHSHPLTTPTVEIDEGLLDSKIWDSWEEDEEEESLPLSQRVKPAPQILKTPVLAQRKRRRTMVPITPMPHYSDMDTPELKNKLNRFGVRPLPKRKMIIKLKEIHQYTHQLTSSDSEDEEPSTARSTQVKPLPIRPVSCASTNQFKEPRPPAASPGKHNTKVVEEEGEEPLSASQGSNTSSTAASEESERSNPELIMSSDRDSDSDGGVSASQSASRLQDRLLAVRSFILSHPDLHGRILQYQPLVLSQLQEQLKAAGIRLGAAKLVDYLDSQCITFTTAKPGQPAAGRGRRTRTRVKTGTSRKKGTF